MILPPLLSVSPLLFIFFLYSSSFSASSFRSSSRRLSAVSPRIRSPASIHLHKIFLCTHRRRSNCNRVLFRSSRTCSGPPRQSTAHLLSDPFLLPSSHHIFSSSSSSYASPAPPFSFSYCSRIAKSCMPHCSTIPFQSTLLPRQSSRSYVPGKQNKDSDLFSLIK